MNNTTGPTTAMCSGFVILTLTCWTAMGSVVASARAVQVSMASPDVVELIVQAGQVQVGRQVPYAKQAGDVVREREHSRYLLRKGKTIGVLVGQDMLRPFDSFSGADLDTRWADSTESYWIESADDERYRTRRHPVKLYRKSRPIGVARTGNWKFAAPMAHHLYLVLPQGLKAGTIYEMSFEGNRLPPTRLDYQPSKIRSESVHVSHIGFHPNDPAKVAFLSCWMGNGGGLKYPDGLPFHVINDRTKALVYSGKTSLAKRSNDRTEDAYKRNFNLTDVYEMDFTPVNQSGRYRVSVEGIGCSYPFDIGRDVWRHAFRTSARGFYHQRSGIALEPPYTGFKRPRSFHPEEGVKVYLSTTRLMDTRNGLSRTDPSNFRNLVAGQTDTLLNDVWGGYMDAGDWDRRIQHLIVSLYLLDLAEQFPSTFNALSLNIPESQTPLPDVVDESLFNLDFYRRTQTKEGGIRGGVESEEHPNFGEASWQESLKILAYAPGSWSSFYYAGVAAKAAFVLKRLGHDDLAQVYQASAIRAMTWAETDYAGRGDRNSSYMVNDVKIDRMDDHIDVRDKRNYAAAELFRLTGDLRWHAVFVSTTKLNKAGVDLYLWKSHEQSQAAWTYVNTNKPGVDPKLQAFCKQAILKEAQDRLKTQSGTGFRWTKNDWAPPNTTLSVSDSVSLVRAHRLTGEAKYLRAIVLACQAGLGANPLNLCYTTRLGYRWPRNPLHLDSRHTGQLPPEGLTVFGPIDPKGNDTFMGPVIRPHLFPAPEKWPIMEAYWDVFWYPIMCEFTVQHPMARNAYIWGYLAGVHSETSL